MATKTLRGSVLTPELQEQLTNYYPLIKKMAFQARQKYRKSMPDFDLNDWRSELTLQACRIAPCWDPSKGCFGTLIKVGLGNIIKNRLRDYVRATQLMPMAGQLGNDLLPLTPGKHQDIPDEIAHKETTDQARLLLDEIRSDIAAANHGERASLVKDFIESVHADWLHGRQSRDIGELIGCTENAVQKARGLPATAAPKRPPKAPVVEDLPVVEPTPSPAPEAPSRPTNRGKRWTPQHLPEDQDPFVEKATIDAKPTGQPRRKFGLNQASRRWLVWG